MNALFTAGVQAELFLPLLLTRIWEIPAVFEKSD